MQIACDRYLNAFHISLPGSQTTTIMTVARRSSSGMRFILPKTNGIWAHQIWPNLDELTDNPRSSGFGEYFLIEATTGSYASDYIYPAKHYQCQCGNLLSLKAAAISSYLCSPALYRGMKHGICFSSHSLALLLLVLQHQQTSRRCFIIHQLSLSLLFFYSHTRAAAFIPISLSHRARA